jgi:hypothetical protein
MRRRFGGSVADWAFTVGSGNIPALAAGVTCLFYDAQAGGNQITDLSTSSDGTSPINQVTSAIGSSTAAPGQLPIFYGPDGVGSMWMSVNGAARALLVANDALDTWVSAGASNTFTAPNTFTSGGNVFAGSNSFTATQAFVPTGNVPAMQVRAASGQTSDLVDYLNSAGATVASVDPSGRVFGANLGMQFTIAIPGNLAVGAGKFRVYNDCGTTLTVKYARISVNTNPTGADIIADFNISNTTIFTTQTNRPRITAGTSTSGRVSNMDVVAFPNGAWWTVDIDQIGSSVPGADYTAQLFCV